MPRSFDSELVCVQNPTSRPRPPKRTPPPNPNSIRFRWSRATPPRTANRPSRCSPPTCTTLPRPVFNTSAPSVVLPTVYATLAMYDTGSSVIYSRPLQDHVSTKTKLPVSYIANVAYTVGNTTLGADVLNTGRGSVVHVGGEQRLGLFAVPGGVARDQRKRLEFGFGGGA